MEARVYCKELMESILSRASWEVLGGGMFDEGGLYDSSLPQACSDCGKGILLFEEEVRGGQGKP